MYHILLFLSILVAFTQAQIIANIEAGKTGDIAVYFPAEKDITHDVFKNNQKEQLLTIVTAGENARESSKYGSGFVIRSADFKTRVRVDIGQSRDSPGNPYTLSFYNLALGDRGGDEPVELQHSSSGYIWVDGGKKVVHNTDINHPFTIRNTEKDIIFTITLQMKTEL